MGEVVRGAIDIRLPRRGPSHFEAIAAILTAEPMDVPDDVAELKREIAETRRTS